jgi:cytochrome P450
MIVVSHKESLTSLMIVGWRQAFIMIVAGFVTTATAMSFALYHLGSHPAKLARLRREIDSFGSQKRPTYDQLLEEVGPLLLPLRSP